MLRGLLFIPYAIMGLVVHIWTIYVAYQIDGFWAAVVSFIFPLLSQIYWIYATWNINPLYAKVTLTYLLLGIFVFRRRVRTYRVTSN